MIYKVVIKSSHGPSGPFILQPVFSCVCSGPRTKPKELEEIGIHARTIEQDLQTDSGNGNGSTYKIKQLFNRHGYNLAILRGHVKGKFLK